MTMRYFFLSITLLLLCCALTLAESPFKYSQIKIFVPDQPALDRIWKSGLDYEGSSGKIGEWMQFVAGREDLKRLAQNNITYSIVIDDLTKEYQKHLSHTPQNALGFGYGSMGGFYTYDEVVQQLDSMKSRFPNLITARETIATTGEGRKLWVAKISANPDVNDTSKPEAFYTGLHHAREPQGMMEVIYYMWWLLENYGTNPDATYLVNNRQMWFLPVSNPDGYAFNQVIAPGGGGMWRKNRRENGDGTFGVDLNRNYGNMSMWNSPNGGSDEFTQSDAYRGTKPFSEPETKGIANFLAAHNIKTCINYHTYGGYLIYPWGYILSESKDSVAFREFAFDITGYNRYLSGTDMQTVYYVTRGSSDDYMYGDTTKPSTFTITLEVGGEFWASTDLILPLAKENLEPNKYMSFAAGSFPVTKRIDLADENHNDAIERGESFSLGVKLHNKGLGNSGQVFVNISSTNPGLVWTKGADTINTIPARGDSIAHFTGLRDGSNAKSTDKFIVIITDAKGYIHCDSILASLGTPTTLLADSASDATANWNAGQSWDVTELYQRSEPFSFTDNPYGDYSNNADNAMTLLNAIDLSGFNRAQLKFWAIWAIQPAYDFAFVEISSDAGSTWDNIRTSLSHRGSGLGVQDTELWGFDGYTPGLVWTEQVADLSSYIGSQVLVRFRVVADNFSTRDGLYVDDIKVVGYKDTTSTGTSVLSVRQKWNLISLPTKPSNRSTTAIFPSAGSAAYCFDRVNGYVTKDTLLEGVGYWLKFDSDENITVSGTWNYLDTIDVQRGWNMIGSISTPIATATIGSDQAGLIAGSFYAFSKAGYTAVDTISPGVGYWVKVNGVGKLILSASPALTAKNRLRIVPTSELPPPAPGGEGTPSLSLATTPREFRLEQNYPNPFNPSTTINYALPQATYVTLRVYNTLGQEITTLLDGMQGPGYKSVEFGLGDLPTGIYFYRLTAGSFTDVKKMVVIK
jgi:carboxypeptidase T